jgi:hypothetical protein
MRCAFPRLPQQSGAVPRLKPGRVAALIGVIFLGAACVDGYPLLRYLQRDCSNGPNPS